MKQLTFLLLFIAASLTAIAQNSAHDINDKLGRGINFGNMFESDRNGDGLGPEIHKYFFEEIADKGFDHIRVPIKWSHYTREEPPYTIEPEFLDTIRTVVDMALEHQLLVMINIHHYDEIFTDPEGHTDRLLYIWKQISEEFKDYSDSLVFEILNEPHDQLTPEKWNALFPRALDTIRVENPTRKVVIGTAPWGGVGGVDDLVWPEDDENLILTVHYYSPFHFTHQGASWSEGSEDWIGTTWDSTTSEVQAIANDFAGTATFSSANNVPVHVGEFGAYSVADMESRKKWTACVARTVENLGFSFAYWEFKAGFGAYDPGNGFWRNELLFALTEQLDPNTREVNPWEIGNSDFYRGLTGWSFYAQGGAVANPLAVNEEVLIDITTPGESNWMVQFMQSGLELIKNAQYRFSYDARYEGTETLISPSLGMSSDPYTGYSGGNEVTLTELMTTYSFDFTMTYPSDNNARAAFNLSYENTKIYLDNIYLELLFMPTHVEEITISPDPAEIDTEEGEIQLIVEVLPEDATDLSVAWEIVSGADLTSISSQGVLTANGTADGTVKVRATAKDGSGIYDELSVVISNQNVGIENEHLQKFYAAVLDQRIEYTVPESEHTRTIKLYSIDGRKLYSTDLEPFITTGAIQMHTFESNIYILELEGEKSREILKITY